MPRSELESDARAMGEAGGDRRVGVVIVGAGPAGLRAATELAWDIPDTVLVVDRQDAPGGAPRSSRGHGFGRRDIFRLMSGPRYAAELSARARRAGAEFCLGATATGWAGPRALTVTSPGGRCVVSAEVVVVATGAPEPPSGIGAAGGQDLGLLGGMAIDEVTGRPRVDSALRTDRDGVFAIGHLSRPVGDAGSAALDGLRVRQPILDLLAGWRPPAASVDLRAGDGLEWIAPGVVRGDEPPTRGYVLAGCSARRRVPKVVARQADTVIGWRRLPWPAIPGRVLRIPWTVLREASAFLHEVTISVE